MYYDLTAAGDCHLSQSTFKPMKARLHSDVWFSTIHHKINLQMFNVIQSDIPLHSQEH